jgi:hypothetical protein
MANYLKKFKVCVIMRASKRVHNPGKICIDACLPFPRREGNASILPSIHFLAGLSKGKKEIRRAARARAPTQSASHFRAKWWSHETERPARVFADPSPNNASSG